MPKQNHAQYSFEAGEMSPKAEMRDDWELRAAGVESLINFFIHMQGPIESSPGFAYIEDSPGVAGRITPFYVSLYAGFIVLITPEYVYVTDRNGFINHDDIVTNGDFLDGGDGWLIEEIGAASVSFVGGSCVLSPGIPAAQHARIRQNMTVIPNEPYQLIIQIVAGTGPIQVQLGTGGGGTQIYNAEHSGNQTIILDDMVSTTGTMSLTIFNYGGNPIKSLDKITAYNTSIAPERVEFASPWLTRDSIASMQFLIAPGTWDLWMTSHDVHPYRLSYDPDTRDWDFELIPFTNPPDEWAAGNYPVAISFFEGRVYLGGTKVQPEDFWASRPGEYHADPVDPENDWDKYLDFALVDEEGVPQADSAIHFTIEKKGRIRWMMASKNLVIGTENSEFIATSDGGIIMPGDVQVTIQSTYGSLPMQALEIGNDILFVSPDGRKIRTMGYEWTKEAWTAKDVTFVAEHITDEGNALSNLHYAPNPYGMLFGVTAIGDAIGCAYNTDAKTGGFFNRTTQGPIKSTCVLPFGGADEIWVLVDRDAEGPDLSLEKIISGEDTKLDSYIILTSETPTTEWSAPHLGGMLCQALADGAVHPNIDVDADGSFETQMEVSTVSIGLQFISYMRTMPVATSVQYVGTSRPMKKRWSKLFAKIRASFRPKINGRRPPTRHASTPMGEMEPARTEIVKVSNLGWDDEGRIEFEQDLPVKTEILGIYGELNQEGL